MIKADNIVIPCAPIGTQLRTIIPTAQGEPAASQLSGRMQCAPTVSTILRTCPGTPDPCRRDPIHSYIRKAPISLGAPASSRLRGRASAHTRTFTRIFHPLAVVAFLALAPPAMATRELSLSNPSVDSSSVKVAEPMNKQLHLAQSTVKAIVKAPLTEVWDSLVDYPSYPKIFKHIKSVTITNREHNLVYIETHLKQEMFVKNEIQHTVNDLSGKPALLKWELLDGNFKHILGQWSLKPLTSTSCQIIYSLSIDPGPFIPPQLCSFLIHFFQNEIVDSLKRYVEANFLSQQTKPV